jgi:hypothetical protein
MISPALRVKLIAAAAIPFVFSPLLLTLSLGPMARAGASWFHWLADRLPCAAEPRAPASTVEPDPSGVVGDWQAEEVAPHDAPDESISERGTAANGTAKPKLVDRRGARVGNRAPANGASIAAIGGSLGGERATSPSQRPHVFVGPESIQRAIPAPGRPTSTWTDRTAEHPAGVLIQNPGVLRGVIEAGDILIEAEGEPLGSFEQLVVTVKQAYERRVKRLSGRIFRRGHFVPVTVEPGW